MLSWPAGAPAHACGDRNCLVGGLGACGLPGLGWEVARRGEGSIVVPDAWNWLVGVVPTARRRLGLLPGALGAEVRAAAGVTATVVWWRCGLLPAGWGAAG
jgi:hypothetical protein